MVAFFREMLDTRPWLVALSGTVLTFLVLTLDLWTLRCIFKWDAWNVFWPWFNYVAESLAQGRFPLWDPRPNCGFPFFAEPQTGVFYPPLLGAAWLFGGSYAVYQYFWLLHWLWGTIGFFCLTRQLGLSPAAAFVGSVTFALNGFFIGNAEHTGIIITMSFVPWTLVFMDKAYRGTLFHVLPAGLMMGLTGLGGNPAMTIYAVVMIAVWGLLKYRGSGRILLILVGTFVVMTAVLSPAYLSFLLETRGYTDRSGYLPVEEACGLNSFTWSALISLIAPSVIVNYPQLLNIPVPTIPMLNGYMGLFAVAAILVTLFNRNLRREWRWLIVFMLISFLFSLGTSGGLRVAAYYLLPFLRFVRHTGISRIFWMMGGAILVAVFFQELTRTDNNAMSRDTTVARRVLLALLCAILLTFAWVWIGASTALEHTFDQTVGIPKSFAGLFGQIGIQALLVSLLILGLHLHDRSPGRLAVALLAAVIIADCAVHFQTCRETVCWNTKAVSVAGDLERISKQRMALPLSADDARSGRPGFFNMWAFDGRSYVRTYLAATSGTYNILVGNTWPPYHDTSFLRALEKMPRFSLIPQAVFVNDRNAEALALLRNHATAYEMPLFVHDPSRGDRPAVSTMVPKSLAGSIEVVSYKPEEVTLKVQAPQNCWLFASERFAPGWKAYLDDTEVKIYLANFAFRALEIPTGNHVIRMTYSPWVYRPLLVLSWGLIVFIPVFWVGAEWRRIRETTKEKV